jgi:hypothetical protein
MSNEQRKMFAEKLLDLANLVAGALVFGQFVAGQTFSILTFLLGIILAAIMYYGAYRASRINTLTQ